MNSRTLSRTSSTSGGNVKSIIRRVLLGQTSRRLVPAVNQPTPPGMNGDDRRQRWDRETLPEGDEKKQAVRAMFDAIAPRYDLVNRIMTFRLDVRWRRRTVRDLALPRRFGRCSTSRPAPVTCASICAAPGYRPISIDLSYGMLAADRSGAPRVQADILRLPVPDGLGRRRHVRVRTAQPGRPRDVLRRAGPGRAPRRTDRPARRRRPPEPV